MHAIFFNTTGGASEQVWRGGEGGGVTWTRGKKKTLKGCQRRHVHDGAGVASRLAAVADQEGSVLLASQQRLGLTAVDVAQTPQTLVVVREVLLVLHRAVLARDHRRDTV